MKVIAKPINVVIAGIFLAIVLFSGVRYIADHKVIVIETVAEK